MTVARVLFGIGVSGTLGTLCLAIFYPLGPPFSFGDGVMFGVCVTFAALAFVLAPAIWVLSGVRLTLLSDPARR